LVNSGVLNLKYVIILYTSLFRQAAAQVGDILTDVPQPKYWGCVPGIPGGVDASALMDKISRHIKYSRLSSASNYRHRLVSINQSVLNTNKIFSNQCVFLKHCHTVVYCCELASWSGYYYCCYYCKQLQ